MTCQAGDSLRVTFPPATSHKSCVGQGGLGGCSRFSDPLQPGLELLLEPLVRGLVVALGFRPRRWRGRQIVLLDMMAGKIVGVLVPLAVAEPLGAGVMAVLQ